MTNKNNQCDAAVNYGGIHQLNKKEDGKERKPIFPVTPIQAVYDARTGSSLEAILAQFNAIYVQYQGSPQATRNIIPEVMRRAGLKISYKDMEGTTIEEQCRDDKDKFSDAFGNDENWIRYDNLLENIEKTYFIALERVVAVIDKLKEGVTPDMLSESVKQLLAEAGATITNLPDEEDITTTGGTVPTLKFKDKEYLPEMASGLGRVILRKNFVGRKNILTQEMISKPNTIYIIQYDFDLNGAEITIPEGCTLDFQGGSLANGIVDFNYCNIRANYKVFDNITFGTKPGGTINVLWFGAKGDRKTDNTEIFKKAFLIGIPIYIPAAPNYYIIKDTITVYNNVKCEGRILFTPKVETNIPAFLVKGGEFSEKSQSSLIVDGIDVTQHETYWTATGIKVERLDTKLENCFFYALKYGIDLNSYSIKVDKCTVRSCNVNLVIRALNELNQCNDITVTNCTLGQAQWLAADIGGMKPSSLKGWNGWNILFQGCSFDEASVRIDHSYNVSIRDCYFERANATNIGVIINEDPSEYTSHHVNIDNCSFLNLKFAIDCRNDCNGLSVTNCTFKSIKRCAICCTLSILNNRITVLNNRFNDTVKRLHYGVELWDGNFNRFNFDGLTYDDWYMTNGVQDVPRHGVCDFITKTYKSYLVLENDYLTTCHIKSIEPFGNTYYKPVTDVAAIYTKGDNAMSNSLSIINDSDFYNFNIWDQIVVKDSNGVSHNMLITSTLNFRIDNSLRVIDLSGALMESGECTVSQRSAIFSTDWYSKAAPTTKELAFGTIINIPNSKQFYKYNGTSWDLYNEDGSLNSKVKIIHKGMTNADILNTAYRNSICVNDEIDLEGKVLTLLDYGTLEFKQGGKFINGTVNLHNTKLLPNGCNPSDYMSTNPTGSYREGQIIYDPSLKKQKLWDGTNWVNLDGTSL